MHFCFARFVFQLLNSFACGVCILVFRLFFIVWRLKCGRLSMWSLTFERLTAWRFNVWHVECPNAWASACFRFERLAFSVWSLRDWSLTFVCLAFGHLKCERSCNCEACRLHVCQFEGWTLEIMQVCSSNTCTCERVYVWLFERSTFARLEFGVLNVYSVKRWCLTLCSLNVWTLERLTF